MFAKLIYKNHLIYNPYNKGERETPSEVKTYRLVLEDCHSTGTLLKRLEYVTVLTYSQIFIHKKYGAHYLLFDAIFKNISFVIPLSFSCFLSIKYHKNKYFKIWKIAFQSVAKKGKSTNCAAKN